MSQSIESFKQLMREVCAQTRFFPARWQVDIDEAGGCLYQGIQRPLYTKIFSEVLGQKNLIAEWMRAYGGIDRTFYDTIIVDLMLTAINDAAAEGYMPIAYSDYIIASDAAWFLDQKRSDDIAKGFYQECKHDGVALVQGESAVMPLFINQGPIALPSAVLCGTVMGMMPPYWNPSIAKKKVVPGGRIIGVASSGLHANGSEFFIKRVLTLPDQFLTKLPNGKTLGEEALTPTRSYVALVEALLHKGVKINRIVPATGGGVSKLAARNENVMYRIYDWPKNIPPLFYFFKEQFGLSMRVLLTTVNWGIGYYLIVPPYEVKRSIEIGTKAEYDLMEIGWVEESNNPHVYFEPAGLALPPGR